MNETTGALAALEMWWKGEKGRYVADLGVGTTLAATCWSLRLGNVLRTPGEDWHQSNKSKRRAEVFAEETLFFDCDDLPPNFVIAGTDDNPFPGLAATILAAIARANELGL